MDVESSSRRPIASRDSGWARRTAAWLASKNVSPNFISILSIVFAGISLLAFFLAYRAGQPGIWTMLVAIVGIQGRLIMNLLDGMVAVEHNKKSAVGGIFNEVPDRVSDTLTLFGVGLMASTMPYGMDLAYLAIALSIATAYIRTLGASLGCGHHFLGPMAKQHRMALISAGCIIGIFYAPIFYYLLILMNVGLVITCYRRLAKVYSLLLTNPKP
ncbi:CDP-alcohol phosphatidyltransferase family protein [Fulvivirgaceae bacterium PWU5]|uniref:CDP-alcohol phosphatidyltransferase family protein n=1 Tax=Dawidia cretensis TaxID=2782350 RepID=A0AAP2GVP1_9BACT|nr:CDP-alcohol phosphatidyltransferase family protein [Dawidia cretensis]MBT1711178.1 CDP-alcohol phosphatidyltransferase family protein [Dawidia cretensis]